MRCRVVAWLAARKMSRRTMLGSVLGVLSVLSVPRVARLCNPPRLLFE